ncbi:hypothetical protein niasHT_029903 [Heterodera trifolii]|uniref:Uncharacterized protein n=1 Tax=Heterodera trifolii TaxID=157864 RepID=A0ABD2KB58_9BILA
MHRTVSTFQLCLSENKHPPFAADQSALQLHHRHTFPYRSSQFLGIDLPATVASKDDNKTTQFICSRRSSKPLGAKIVFSAFFFRSSGKDRFFNHDCASIAAAVPCAVCAENTDRRAFAGRSPLRYELWRTTSST